MIQFFKRHRLRFSNFALLLLLLLPVIGCLRLVRQHAVDQRFMDDWAWAQDVVKFKSGTPPGGTTLLHDLFSVHLEHRPAVPRILTMLVTVAANGDVQAQNALTLLFIGISYGALCWLWLRRNGAALRDAWLPLLLAAGVMFSPVQWETLLWPVCVGTVMPMTFLMLSFCTAFLRREWWVRCLAGTGLAILGMMSFASGTLAWVLPLPVYLFCGKFQSNRQRWKFAGLWGAMLAVTLFFYFQVQVVQSGARTEKQTHLANLPGHLELIYDLHNEALPQYAYHQGETNTMDGALPYFLSHPAEDEDFVAVFSGAFAVRGWAMNTARAAKIAGYIFLAGLALLAYSCWRWRRNIDLLRSLLPMLCLGAYTPVTGLMVALGRIYAGHLAAALNTRYHAHQTQIIVALIGGAYFLGRHLLRERPAAALRAAGFTAGGVLAAVIGIGWIFGAGMMEAWQAARFRNAAAQFVSQIFPAYNHFVAWVAGNHRIARDVTDALDRQGLIRQRPLRDTKFASLTTRMRVSDHTLYLDRAMVRQLKKVAQGGWTIDGYAGQPFSLRPADGIILAYRVPGGDWTVWGFTQPNGAPMYLSQSLGKDMWGIAPGREPWPRSLICPLEDEVATNGELPAGAKISFWAMDMQHHDLFRISRNKNGTPDEDGLTIGELAEHYDSPPDVSGKSAIKSEE